ncbi:MAG TPA: SDR family NAD(P)-dependent oxidoreductase [Ramlibacter sp.]|nr:SDR family NAD(P)-dependent oxidoreductase [Ramlibacter sp.]
MGRDFEQKVFLVAGASGGIGLVISRLLLERGARVALHYRSNARQLEELAQKFGADKAILVRANLTVREEVETMVSQVVSRFEQLNGFLCTVGTALRMKPFLDTPEELIDQTIAIELRSVITGVRAVLPHLVAAGGGRIVLVGSDSGKVGTTGESVSAACRGGIIAFAKSIAREYARSKVLANVVCPGPTDTGLWNDLVTTDEFSGKVGNAMIRSTALRRLAAPEEVAATAVFLASPEASFITGQAISVSGGLTMC